jgi:preprotein translocase subunit SecD
MQIKVRKTPSLVLVFALVGTAILWSRGRVHYLIEVHADDAVRSVSEKNVDLAKSTLPRKGWPFNDIKATGLGQITISVPDSSKSPEIVEKLGKDFNGGGSGWVAAQTESSVVFSLSQTEQNELRERAIEETMRILKQRAHALGVIWPSIQRQDTADRHEVAMEMWGIGTAYLDDPERTLNILLDHLDMELKSVPRGTEAPYSLRETAEAAIKSLPGGSDAYETVRFTGEGHDVHGYIILERNPVVTGTDVRDAEAVGQGVPGTSPAGYPEDYYQVNLLLASPAAQRLGGWTGAHVGDRLAFEVNHEVWLAPTIKAKITDRMAVFCILKESAEDLALVLRSGAPLLPTTVARLEERVVGGFDFRWVIILFDLLILSRSMSIRPSRGPEASTPQLPPSS